MTIDLDPPAHAGISGDRFVGQHGKQYVTFLYKSKRTTTDVNDQIRKGWYGDPEWKGQTGGLSFNFENRQR